MRRLAILACLALAAGAARPSEWMDVTHSKDGESVAVDSASIIRDGVFFTAWVRFQREHPEAMERVKINCKSKQYSVLHSIQYDENGVTKTSRSFRAPSWDEVVPDSVMEDVVRHVCLEHGFGEWLKTHRSTPASQSK